MAPGREIHSWKDLTSGYRFSLVGGALACLVTLVVNISFMFWVTTLPEIDRDSVGRRVLYEGSCDTTKTINTVLHVFINLFSSILLGASNYGIQCLSSPTREQVDKAHAEDTYLDIGIVSVRNLSRQTRQTRALWFILFLSSVPIHLLYNSVVYSSLTVPLSYNILSTDERFVLSETILDSEFKHVELTSNKYIAEADVRSLLEESYNPAAFDNLTASECIGEYGVSFLTSRRDVILVNEPIEGQNLTFYVQIADPMHQQDTFGWICSSFDAQCRPLLDSLRANTTDWQPHYHRVKYCLSRAIDQLCRVNFDIFLAVSVISCNLVKVAILVYIAMYLAPDRLLVLGDAIQSFLTRPDLPSGDNPLLSARHARHFSSYNRRPWASVSTLTSVGRRWRTPVSQARWAVGTGLYLTSTAISLFLLIWGIRSLTIPRTWNNIWSLGFGETTDQTIIRSNFLYHNNVAGNVILANLPHLIFSVMYFQWNAIFTSISMGKEWNDFSQRRAALRVSDKPQGVQCSRYFLQLPYQFGTPLIAISILLHWLLSQSMFVVAVEGRDETDAISKGFITCGYSPIAIMAVLLASLSIPISVVVASWRRLPGLMPVTGSCSLAIAAACHHPDGGAHPSAALGLVKWGVMIDWEKKQSQDENGQGEQERPGPLEPIVLHGHCGFSIDNVDEPVEGQIYACRGLLACAV